MNIYEENEKLYIIGKRICISCFVLQGIENFARSKNGFRYTCNDCVKSKIEIEIPTFEQFEAQEDFKLKFKSTYKDNILIDKA